MKLFNAIFAAALVGASLVSANPVEAGSRWVKTTSSEAFTGYASGIQKRGNIATFQRIVVPKARGESSWESTAQMDCKNWRVRIKLSRGWGEWQDVLPGTNAEGELEVVCR